MMKCLLILPLLCFNKSIRGIGNLRKLVFFGNSKAGFAGIYLQKLLLALHFKGWEEDGFKCKT